jgi:hypothetical protein
MVELDKTLIFVVNMWLFLFGFPIRIPNTKDYVQYIYGVGYIVRCGLRLLFDYVRRGIHGQLWQQN